MKPAVAWGLVFGVVMMVLVLLSSAAAAAAETPGGAESSVEGVEGSQQQKQEEEARLLLEEQQKQKQEEEARLLLEEQQKQEEEARLALEQKQKEEEEEEQRHREEAERVRKEKEEQAREAAEAAIRAREEAAAAEKSRSEEIARKNAEKQNMLEQVESSTSSYESIFTELFSVFWKLVYVDPNFVANDQDETFQLIDQLLKLEATLTPVQQKKLSDVIGELKASYQNALSPELFPLLQKLFSGSDKLSSLGWMQAPAANCFLALAFSQTTQQLTIRSDATLKASVDVCKASLRFQLDRGTKSDAYAGSLYLHSVLLRQKGHTKEADYFLAQATTHFNPNDDESGGLFRLFYLGFSAFRAAKEGQSDVALELVNRAEIVAKATLDHQDYTYSISLSALAAILSGTEKTDEAVALAHRALDSVTRVFGRRHPLFGICEVVLTMDFTGGLADVFGSKAYDRALQFSSRVFGSVSSTTSLLLAGKSLYLGHIQDLKGAEEISENARVSAEKSSSSFDRDTLAPGLRAVHSDLGGHPDEADQSFKQAIQNYFGADFWGYATYLAVTGIRHDLKGERALAEAAYDDLYHVITRLSGKTVRELAEGGFSLLLGIRHDLVGEHVRAENVFDKAFSVYRGEMSQLIKLTRYRLLEVTDKAKALEKELRDSLLARLAALREKLNEVLPQLGVIFGRLELIKEQHAVDAAVLPLLRSMHGKGSSQFLSAAWVEHSRLQASLKVCRQSEVAEDLLLSLEKSDPEKKMRSLLVSSGFANFDCHEIERCRQLLERALPLFSGPEKTSEEYILSLLRLATSLFQLGHHEQSRKLIQEAIQLVSEVSPSQKILSEFLIAAEYLSGQVLADVLLKSRDIARVVSPKSKVLAWILLRLAEHFFQSCKHEELKQILIEMGAMSQRFFTENLLEYSSWMSMLSTFHIRDHNLQASEAALRKSLSARWRGNEYQSVQDGTASWTLKFKLWLLQ